MDKRWKEDDDGQIGRTKRELRELEVEELKRGYVWSESEESYTCIFCGEVFQEGVIYPFDSGLLTAERAMKEHVFKKHGGSFACLLSMDRQINGLTDIQKKMLSCFYEGRETEEICGIMDITPATVRTHRYNLQKLKREAKILLALMEQLEREDRPPLPGNLLSSENETHSDESPALPQPIPGSFCGNSLHPFFMQRRFE